MNNHEPRPVEPTPAPLSEPETGAPLGAPSPRRLFLHEPGWRVALKVGSERTFCYMMAPGQDYYHRLLDGEVYLHHGDERLCIACAERRGLLAYEAKGLRPKEALQDLELNEPGHEDAIALEGDEDEDEDE